MQYAAVWLEDGSGIIQIGMETRRLLEKLEEKNLPNIISMMPFEMNGYLYVVDKNPKQLCFYRSRFNWNKGRRRNLSK